MMNKQRLLEHIKLYRDTENIIHTLDTEYGIQVWDSLKPNFYNNYNLIIHKLLVDIFGEDETTLLEDYIFGESRITFEELCKILKLDEAN